MIVLDAKMYVDAKDKEYGVELVKIIENAVKYRCKTSGQSYLCDIRLNVFPEMEPETKPTNQEH